MSKILAVMIAGLFAAGAYAQNPAGVSSEQAPITNSKGQQRAQQKVESRPQTGVKSGFGGDVAKTPESGAIGTGKAAAAGEARAETRDTRRRNKDGSIKKRSSQGGTPDMPGAK